MGHSDLKNICVITPNYPRPRFPEEGAFVERLVNKWREQGVLTDVVAPESIPDMVRSFCRTKEKPDIAGNCIRRPKYMSLSNKSIGPLDLKALSRNFFLKAVNREVNKLSVPDFYYGKFLMKGGMAALEAGKENGRPAVADLGESRLMDRMNDREIAIAREKVPEFEGFACVSDRLMDEIKELGAKREQVLYAPNTVDLNRFRPLDKSECRKKLNVPEDAFIVIFVGHFIERKGPMRVLEAVNMLDLPVKGVFLGRGNQVPEGSNVLYAGSVPNEEVPVWLNSADLFVLPTLAEGNCNAINEAMACGLPVVSSDITDVRGQVTDGTGILVDPLKRKEIARAIRECYKDRNRLDNFGDNCLKEVKRRFKKSRAERVLEWMNTLL